MALDPDFQGDLAVGGDIGVIQIGAEPYVLPAGSAGDVLILWLVCEPSWSTGIFPTLFAINQADSSGTTVGSLTVVHQEDLADARLFVCTGTRATALDEVRVIFGDSRAGPTGWVIGSFPPAVYADAGEQVLSGVSDSFTPAGSGVFAGIIVGFWESDGTPFITSPAVISRPGKNEVYNFRAFGWEGAGPFAAEMAEPSNELVYGHALLSPAGYWRVGRIGWPA